LRTLHLILGHIPQQVKATHTPAQNTGIKVQVKLISHANTLQK